MDKRRPKAKVAAMFVIKVYRSREGDLPDYGDAVLDVELDSARVAACARLDGAQARAAETTRPLRARVYRVCTDSPNLLVSELHATEHGAVEIEERPH